MRNVALIALGFALLIMQAVLATLVPIHAIAPNLLLPAAIYLGVAPDVHVVRGAALSFVLGYLLDAFCGNPMGLQTFVLVATFAVARLARLRLFLRGPAYQILLTFVVGLLAGATILALRAFFEKAPPFPVGTAWDSFLTVLLPAVATALVAPFVFAVVRRVDGAAARRREEGHRGGRKVVSV